MYVCIFCVNQTTFCVNSTTPSSNSITLQQWSSGGVIHPLPQVTLLYSCHLAGIDGVVWHHLKRGCTSNSIENKPLLDVLRVALFLPFSLNRRLIWHHLTRGCALNSIENKQLLDVLRVALFLPFSLNRRLFWHHLTRARLRIEFNREQAVVGCVESRSISAI